MKKLLLIVAVMLAVAGCEANDGTTVGSSGVIDGEPRIIELDHDYELKTLNKFEEAIYDFDGDGNDENILLLTSMIKDDNGFSGDDRNKWLLMVRTAEGTYPLYDDSTNCRLEMNVYEVFEDDGDTVPVIRLTLSSTSAYEIREYRYNDEKFSESTVYSSGAINELPVKKY